MIELNYPPIIESKLSSFIKDGTKDNLTIKIYFKLSKAIGKNDFNGIGLKLKTVTTGTEKYNGETTTIGYEIKKQSYYASFVLSKEAVKIIGGEETTINEIAPLIIGQFYKAQLCFIKYKTNANKEIISPREVESKSPWSSNGIIKCTSAINLSIDSLTYGSNNNNPVDFLGKYINKDVSEKVYSYCFTIYDENNQVFDTSGEQIHNSASDENKKNDDGIIEYNAYDTWTLMKSLEQGKLYRITYAVTTINDYHMESMPYVIREANTVDANIPAKLLATLDPDNGSVTLRLIKPKEAKEETSFSGNFMISRYSDNLKTWNQICKFNMLSQKPSEIGEIWTDYTIEHGVKYLYCIQAYNSKKLYSNRIIHVIGTPNDYLETDENDNPYYLMADFEDAFLTDGERQLKLRFNPKVSSFKPTILESKVDTLGGKYPFIFRNGNVGYKEFPISGMLSYMGDEKELFMKGIRPEEFDLKRERTAAVGSQNRQSWTNIPEAGTKLTSDNFYRERQFKMEALNWLTNGQPKLFRSPGEGSYIVRLMNVSLSPNDALGRMLHTFNATAYEIAEHNFENLKHYNLLHLPEEDNRAMKFTQHKIGDLYNPQYGMYHAFITDAPAYTRYRITWMELTTNSVEDIEIGATGAYYFDNETAPIIRIQKLSGDGAGTAQINYGYYDTIVPDYFSHIANVTSKDEVAQIVGKDEQKEIITTELEDIRRQVNNFYTIIVKPRNIVDIYSYNGKYYRDSYHNVEITGGWIDIDIYYVVNEDKYYNGQPQSNSFIGTEVPDKYFKLNDKYILDLSTGNAIYPKGLDIFVPATNGSYIISKFGKIKSMHLSQGVYAELSYEINEIEYTVEETDEVVKQKKQLWQVALEGSLKEEPTHTDIQVQQAYNNYIKELDRALQEAYEEEYNYAL